MARKHHKLEAIVAKLRQVEVLVGQGMTVWPWWVAICGGPTWMLKDMVLLASLGIAGSVCGAFPAMKQIMA